MARVVGLRFELFVGDVDRSITFYREVLGFELVRQDPGYASIRSGGVVIGLGPIAKLPEEEGYFTRRRLEGDRGAGVEIVLEVDDIEGMHRHVVGTECPILEDLQLRSWGLTDFRIADPDGYYLRITSRE